MFLLLGTLLVIYIENTPSLNMPEKSDDIFGIVATHSSLPAIVGVLFVVGLIAAAYSAAGSALVSLTTSFNEEDAISAVYTLASYTYGPLLGLFIFGMFSDKPVNDRFVPAVCLLAPALCWMAKHYLKSAWDYELSFELLLLNAFLTICGLVVLSWIRSDVSDDIEASKA